MILKVATLGSPSVRTKAKEVRPAEIQTREFQDLIDSMIATMRKNDGVGIAAPQVRVSKAVFCVESVRNPRYLGSPQVPLYVAVNPKVRILDKAPLGLWEGCLSVPGLRGEVFRAKKVELSALDRRGKPFRITAAGFHARIIQHEFDHLQGKIYLDRMKDLRSLAFVEHIERGR